MKKTLTVPLAEDDSLAEDQSPALRNTAGAGDSAGDVRSTDAIFLLRADHMRLKRLLRDVRRQLVRGDSGAAEKTVRRLCRELTLHSAMEQDIFYPAVREALGGSDMLDHAEIEHAGTKSLIAQVTAAERGDGTYAAKITVLANYTAEHMREEEDDLFPRARRAGLDLKRLGLRMLARQRDARAEYDESDADAAEAGDGSPVHGSDADPNPLPANGAHSEQIRRPGMVNAGSPH